MRPRPSRCAAAVIALLTTLLLAAPVAAQSGSSKEREAAEAVLAKAQRLSKGRGIRTGRELTVVLAQLAAARGDLSRSDREEADQLLARPTDTSDTLQTGGPYDPAARVLRNCSANFCVHWVDSTADAPPLANADSCPTPDFVDHVRGALERSRAVENGQLLWRTPVADGSRGGNGLTDVYLKQLNSPNRGLYGYAATDGGQSGRTRYAFMVLDNDYNASEFGRYGGAYQVPAEVTAAHEYNHVLQYAYDIAQDPWMYESTATWMEEKVYPEDDDYHLYMPDWADIPYVPLTAPDGDKMYGSAIWNHWLEQRYGADVIEEAWEQSVASGGFAPDAYELAIENQPGGTSFEENFGDFAAATAVWEDADSGIHEAGTFRRGDPPTQVVVARGPQLAPPTANREVTLDHTSYALYKVAAPGTSALRLTMTLAPGELVAAGTIALVALDEGVVTKVVGRADAVTGGAEVTLPAKAGGYDQITAVVANADVSESGFNAPADDWFWSRDGQTMRISLDAPATPNPSVPAPAEPLAPTSTTPASSASCGTTTVEREPPVVTPTPTPTASPTATPTVTPPPPPPATSVRLTRNTSRIASAARKGVLSLFARTNKAGRLTARATVDTATAKRLKVGRRTTTVGTGRRTATAPARVKINVKLTRKVRAALRRETKRTLRIKVQVAFAPADGTRAVRRTLSVLLRP